MIATSKRRRASASGRSLVEAARVARALLILVSVAALVVILRFAIYDHVHGGRTLAAIEELIRS